MKVVEADTCVEAISGGDVRYYHLVTKNEGIITSRKVIGRLLDPCDTFIQTSVAAESRAQHAVLEPRRVLEINVQLTIQTVGGNGDARPDRSNEGIKN